MMYCRKDSRTVRFLGPWIDRLEKAREVWRKVEVKLPVLGVGLRARARVVQATVVATLLFGAEIRTFSIKDIEKYRKFLGGVIRYISYNKATGEGTMRGMQGNTTTADLRLKAGLEDVQTQIIQGQARYIGHVARYKDTRIERVVLGISSADKKEEGGLRAMYWKKVSEVMEQLRYPEHEWSEKWIEGARDRKSWKQGRSTSRSSTMTRGRTGIPSRTRAMNERCDKPLRSWMTKDAPVARDAGVQHTSSSVALPAT